ncbi:MAG: SDR family NAD(P)-dependent oxidoreductase [Bacteroidales bacterium]|nr:SDR family oxidoreductase [Lentimicrobiaceae bacterium]MDD5694966.1 SDR family NAD(P)-dependent oxidoreductase [Bacteroidales bacterium]
MNIVVTGASRGVGNALVREFAKNPDDSIVAISRNSRALDDLRSWCINNHPHSQIFPVGYDLSRGALDRDLLPVIRKHVDRADVLVNNAGLLIHKPLSGFSPDDVDQLLDINFKAAFFLIQALVPWMNPGAHIVNIGSMGGVQGSVKFPGMSVYSASKGALAILTECLAAELEPEGISVNMLAFGAVDTEMLQMAFPGYKAPVTAEEMASFIADFSRRGHHFFNGKVLPLSLSTP